MLCENVMQVMCLTCFSSFLHLFVCDGVLVVRAAGRGQGDANMGDTEACA